MFQRTTLRLRLCILACLAVVCWAEQPAPLAQLVQNPCSSKTTCSDCIRAASCAWCFAAVFNGPRCFNPASEGGDAGCDEAYVFYPDNQRAIDPAYNKELSRKRSGSSLSSGSASYGKSGANAAGGATSTAGSGEDLVQIKPQRVYLKLRQNQMEAFSFAYSRAQDYPLDLYYLMDVSTSVKNDQEKLAALANLLPTTMKNITSDFRIGFGSFVDKVVKPYVSTAGKNSRTPCEGCAAPYGFKNQMSLSTDTDHFAQAVSKADVAGSADAPEGGLHAIMQAMVCKEEIGWRQKADKLLVFSTDAGFHYAGDGKLGGIVQPYDGECHMKDNRYTFSTVQDYPSISQINQKAKDHSINVIFAVTSEQTGEYEELRKHVHVQGSRSGVLTRDSDNVVDLVREQYNKITSAVEITDTSSDAIQIEYYSSCLDKTNVMKTNKCDGLKVGDVVEFTAQITLKECPKDPSKWKQTFVIYPGVGSEGLTVELEMICDCPCEHPGHYAYNDNPLVCSGHGVSACGVCACRPGRSGESCECSAQRGDSADQDRGCRPTNASSGPVCSGRGNCICGVCECRKMPYPSEVISGPYCECDNFSCDRNRGRLCSGPERGECVCGRCQCRPGYTGSGCQCPLDQAPCRPPDGGDICNGNGKCVCGQCLCDYNGGQLYSGRYCDKCPTCPGRCAQFKECVLCSLHHRGAEWSANQTCTKSCEHLGRAPLIVETGKLEANESKNERLCSFRDEDDCLYAVVDSYDEQGQLDYIKTQEERECPPKVKH